RSVLDAALNLLSLKMGCKGFLASFSRKLRAFFFHNFHSHYQYLWTALWKNGLLTTPARP
ncbi:MAG: hypothetical protein ACXVY3_09545, partial [Gaiellaceae bacterium]